MKDLFQYSELPLADFLSEAANTKDHLIKCHICPVSKKLRTLLAADIGSDYSHILDNYSYHHIRARHSGARESLRGQIPITDDDFILIPDVFIHFDSLEISINKIGNKVILYSRVFEGFTLFLAEEIRTGRRELAVCTLYKRKRKLTDANRPEDDADSGFVPFSDTK